jgi:hypothetical protein
MIAMPRSFAVRLSYDVLAPGAFCDRYRFSMAYY